MKNLKNYVEAQSKVETVNAEGCIAYKKSDEELLDQLAMTGTLTDTFYATANELADDALELLDRAAPEAIAKAIVKGRQEGFIRTFPILGLVKLSSKSSELFKQVFSEVVLTGNDLGDFLDLCRKMRGLGRAVKSAISTWLDKNVNPYYAQKYCRQIADAVRLCRYRGEDPIFGYILAGKDVHGWTAEKMEAAYAKYPELAAHREFLEKVESGDLKGACEILKHNRLDVDSLTAVYNKFDAELWYEIAAQTPIMRFLKYLSKFNCEGVFNTAKGLNLMQTKIYVNSLLHAKVFPFRLYSAYRAVPYVSGVSDRLADVLDEYTTTYDWGGFNDYSWAICPDVSGSMSSNIGNGEMTYQDISGMFVGFFHKGLNDVLVFPWDTEVHDFPVSSEASVLEHIEKLHSLCGGGTAMSCALKLMTEHKIHRDRFIFITDSEEYSNPFCAGVIDPWFSAWQEYRKEVNPKAEAFLIRIDPYGTNPFPEGAAREHGIHQIYGWNDNVVRYIEYTLSLK